jgi:glycosyltransferase involved in cell wall biosynthesis
MRRPSRILYITHTSPVPAKIGPSRRHYHVLDQLSRFYDVHLLALGTQSEAEMFRETFADRVTGFDYAVPLRKGASKFTRKAWRTFTSRCDFLPVAEPNLRRLCSRVTSSHPFDAIVLSIVLLRGLPLPKNVPIVGDTHNVEFDVLSRTAELAETYVRRQYARWQARSTFREEGCCAREVALLLANSERDRQLFKGKLGVANIEVVQNGVDIKEFSPHGATARPGTILFTGLMSYYPNQQGIRWFLDEVFPKLLLKVPNARLIIAGANPPPWLIQRSSDRVEVTGSVPDMRPMFDRAEVVIVPLMIGGGTRVKILEAQAMGKPVVSTSLGAEGIEVRDGYSILLADRAELFAAQVSRLLTDVGLASRIGETAREMVTVDYDWNRIGEHLEFVLRQRIGLTSRAEPEHHGADLAMFPARDALQARNALQLIPCHAA